MKKLLLIFSVFSLSFFGCKEKITIEIPNAEPLLVVEGEVTTEMDSSFVKLTLSSNYYSADPYPNVSNAIVSVNNVPFTYIDSLKVYKPAPGFVGSKNTEYNLNISYNNKVYTAKTFLEPMFRVDSIFQTWKGPELGGAIPAGWSISYAGFDDRPQVKYTYFISGVFSDSLQQDSFNIDKITFDNSLTPVNEPYVFELPFSRFQSGKVFLAIFRSIDKNMYNFINAYNNSNPNIPGPFQSPPANLPTNLTNGAVGYFAAYDVVRKRYTVK